MRDLAMLEKDASLLLGRDVLDGLKEWYNDTLKCEWKYVVYMVRRSYMLALIMEELTGKKMEESSDAVFLTDAAFLLRCEELAEEYELNGCFPKILLCDDVCLHGRNFNHYIEALEERLYELLSNYDQEEIRNALVEAIRLHVYVRSDGALLLLGRYELRLHHKGRKSAAFLHKISNSFSSLILHADMAYAGYIYSESVSGENIQKIDLQDYIGTEYQNTRQYARIGFVGTGEEKKAAFTLRIVQNINQKGYRVIPFVFLPNLNQEETWDLLDNLIFVLREHGISEDFCRTLRELEAKPGKRSFNEWLSLIFSQAVLQEFNEKYQIQPEKKMAEQEIRKLARNYNWHNLEETESLLKEVIQKCHLRISELSQIIDKSIPSSRKILKLRLEQNQEVSGERQNQIKEKLEDYFYIAGSKEELSAFELAKKPYYPTPKRSERVVRECGFILEELCRGFTEAETRYAIAYFLQMMDAGVLSLSSFASNNIIVVGFSQFAKAGEQSLLIRPLRMYEWIPVLAWIQQRCESYDLDIREEMQRYSRSEWCDLSQEQIDKSIRFLEEIGTIGQKAEDWNENYLEKKDLVKKRDESKITSVIVFLDKQSQHVKRYEAYTKA